MDRETAPFTEEQVASLNTFQRTGRFHPFTCCVDGTGCRDRLGCDTDERLLVATEAGWVCPTCDYTQDWAHRFMADWTWLRMTIDFAPFDAVR